MENSIPDFDSLSEFQHAFIRPKDLSGKELHYFCGNSLGLQPVSARSAIQEVLDDWANLAVDGHFYAGKRWYDYPNLLKTGLAQLCGALPEEVQAMGSLSSNLHLMMVSFFRPEGKKRKILMEAGAFPSDQYVVESQLKFHGLDPLSDLIEVLPRENEYSLRTEDIVKKIEENAGELALVLFSGVHYLTGQAFDMESICRAAHKAGAKAGFDLAHAIGNIRLNLHQWEADFAVWCSYKYLNGGPGAVGGIFVHERYAADESLPRFAGWFGHDESLRFRMEKGFRPMYGAQGWQLSNENILSLAAIRASLEIFEKVSPEKLEQRREHLSGRLRQILERFESLKIITPESRGAQISIRSDSLEIKSLFEFLRTSGVIGDYREPGVLRLAVPPLYTREEDLKALKITLNRFFGD
jgi:kynureninase